MRRPGFRRLYLAVAASELGDAFQISLVHRGAHATGLLLVSPLFAVFAARSVFATAALAIPLVGLASAAVAARAAQPSR